VKKYFAQFAFVRNRTTQFKCVQENSGVTMSENEKQRFIEDDAIALIEARRPLLGDTPNSQWPVAGAVVLSSILTEDEYSLLPASTAQAVRANFSESFGSGEMTVERGKGNKGESTARSDGGRQGGRPAGRLLLAAGKRYQSG
jgi:hypothetical protein